MAAWVLVPCLVQLRADLNTVAPGRDRTTDGAIGDANHSSTSDHTPDEISDALRNRDADSRNEVHAVDLDSDLRTPGLTMEMVVQHVVGRCRSGAERRLRYVIYNRRIWEASNGWRQRAYSGANAHDKHAHFSASYDTQLEASTASWHLEDLTDMPLTTDDADLVVDRLLARAIETPAGNFGSLRGVFGTLMVRTGHIGNVQMPAALGMLSAIGANVTADDGDKAQLLAAIQAAGQASQVDEQVIVSGVLTGLDPAAIAAAVAAALPADQAQQVADELAERLAA